MTFADFLKNFRKENHLSQDEMAQRMGVSTITLSRIERGFNFRGSDQMLRAIGSKYANIILGLEDDTDGLAQLKDRIHRHDTSWGYTFEEKQYRHTESSDPLIRARDAVVEKIVLLNAYENDCLEPVFTDFPFLNDLFFSVDWKKNWAAVPVTGNDASVEKQIAFILGRILMEKIWPNRLSFFIDNELFKNDRYPKYYKSFPQNALPFDLSLFLVNTKLNYYQEITLCENRTGTGFFDFDEKVNDEEKVRRAYLFGNRWVFAAHGFYGDTASNNAE